MLNHADKTGEVNLSLLRDDYQAFYKNLFIQHGQAEKTKLLSKRSVNTGSIPVKFFKSHMLLKLHDLVPVGIFGYFSQKR